MANPVTVTDLEDRFRPLTDAETTVAQALIDDAWAVALAYVSDLESQMNAGAVSVDVVRFVVSSMALRVLRNPNGVRSWSVDDYSETRDNSLSAGALYLSDAERSLLTGGVRRRGAFSVAPAAETRSPGAEYQVYPDGPTYGPWPASSPWPGNNW